MNQRTKNRFKKKLNTKPTLWDLLEFRNFGTKNVILLDQIKKGEIALGSIWENVLTEFMDFTTKTSVNFQSMDWEDGTDGKFTMASLNAAVQKKISLGGLKNKIGTLRACICSPDDDFKLYFFLIPHSYYSKLPTNTQSPIKVYFDLNGKPKGVGWERIKNFEVTFDQVSSPV
jgi:hypothetical protein